jgi:hypothetical protein
MEARPAAEFAGDAASAVWLPDGRVAAAWSEYVKIGAVSDLTPPPAPDRVRSVATAGGVEVTWEAEADFESGLQGFILQRDGQELARVPDQPVGRFGRPLFQVMSYHDTPERPLPEMRFLDATAKPGADHEYQVIAVNSTGRRSRGVRARTGGRG